MFPSYNTFVISLALFPLISSAPPRDLLMPPMKLDLFNIKTPQLIGIVLGITVFLVTISTVIYLLYASGTLTGAWQELAQEAEGSGAHNKDVKRPAKLSSEIQPQFNHQPELHDYLLKARDSLPTKPNIAHLTGNRLIMRRAKNREDLLELFNAMNGSAIFHESAYDPARLWGWLDIRKFIAKYQSFQAVLSTTEMFVDFIHALDVSANALLLVEDKEFHRIIGMLALLDNNVEDLSVRIDLLVITPAFQGTLRAHETIFLVVEELFKQGYRRIVAEVDDRHTIASRFFKKMGFSLEATLRKHKIICNRNANTSLFVLLNSDWPAIRDNLRKFVGLEEQQRKKEKVSVSEVLFSAPQTVEGKINNDKSNKKIKKKKRSKGE